MKSIILTLGACLLASCASFPSLSDRNTISTVNPGYEIINLGPEFDQFWQTAENKPFAEQVEIWDRVVEKPHQSFYDGMVWQKSENPKWEERKLRRLKEFFPKYKTIHGEMDTEFRHFNATLEKQIAKFSKFFTDAHFNLPIYAAPTTTFNGKGGEGGDSGDHRGRTALAFGIDMIVDRKDNPDVLYSHELFHAYHTDAIGVNERVFINEGHLTLPLWLEGLATYVSQRMNPKASLNAILMDNDLPRVRDSQVKDLAKQFLAEAEEKAFDPKTPGIYKKWFAIDPQFTLGHGFPQRCGYLLGWKTVQHLAQTHSLQEMVHWKVSEVHSHVVSALKEMASPRNATGESKLASFLTSLLKSPGAPAAQFFGQIK